MQMRRPAEGEARKESDAHDVCACAADFQKSSLTPFCLHQFRISPPLADFIYFMMFCHIFATCLQLLAQMLNYGWAENNPSSNFGFTRSYTLDGRC